MIPLHYAAAIKDTSGYASAARQYVLALLKTEQVDLTISEATFERQKTTHGPEMTRILPLIGKPGVKWETQIVHLTPENYTRFAKKGKYNIAYTTWETDRLPDEWVKLCNYVQEIWVPSEWNKQVFINSGIKTPITVIPHIIRPSLNTLAEPEDRFVFYSIFQWIERKNPFALLKAYFTEFRHDEPVALALKTYRLNASPSEQNSIRSDINRVKSGLRLPQYPPIFFYGNLLSSEQMAKFHAQGECFVLPSRGEGFGIPIAEAMALGKPVITSGYGGVLDFANHNNAYLIDCTETPVYGMIFPNYHGYMNWGDPSVSHLRKLMRHVYENQKEAKKKGLQAQLDIARLHNQEVIGSLMVNRLKEIRVK